MKYLSILILMILFISCKQNRQDDNLKKESMSENDKEIKAGQYKKLINRTKSTPMNAIDDSVKLDGYMGIVDFEFSRDTIEIYNKNGNLFTKFYYYEYPEKKYLIEEMDSTLRQFELFAYHPDYSLLMLYSDLEKDSCNIYLKNGNPKYIPQKSKYYKFYTWREFIMSNNYLSINNELYYTEKSDTSREIDLYGIRCLIYTEAKEFDGDWLKVKFEFDCEERPENIPEFAWIKWKDNGRLKLKFGFIL